MFPVNPYDQASFGNTGLDHWIPTLDAYWNHPEARYTLPETGPGFGRRVKACMHDTGNIVSLEDKTDEGKGRYKILAVNNGFWLFNGTWDIYRTSLVLNFHDGGNNF